MARLTKPRVWVDGFRKERAFCAAIQDPFNTLEHHGWNTDESRHLSRRRSTGLLALYCDGHHLYTDLTYYRYLFDGYSPETPGCHHPGLHLLRREDFKTPTNVHRLNDDHTSDSTRLYLQHNGFSGPRGERTAHVWFHSCSQNVRPWRFDIRPGSIMNLITDCEDWSLETIWFRMDRTVRKELLSRRRHA